MGRGKNNNQLLNDDNCSNFFVKERDLAIRLLNKEPFKNKNVALMALAGSKAYGLANDNSDTDLRGIYLADKNDFLGIRKPEENLENSVEDNDALVYELAKFANLASKANPAVLEMLWSPTLVSSKIGQKIIASRRIFLSQMARKTYSGFAFQQLKDLERFEKRFLNNEIKEDEYYRKRAKRARHLLRLSEQGINLLKEQEIVVQVKDRQAIKEAEQASLTELKELFAEKDALFKEMPSDLPEKPDLNKINQLVIDLRLSEDI
jgi:predicted nucleotidyltransferase